MKKVLWSVVAVCFSLASCQSVSEQVDNLKLTETASDPHSRANFDAVYLDHLSLNLTVNFENQTLSGSAEWHLKAHQADSRKVIFDTYKLSIDSIVLDNKTQAEYSIGEWDEILGAPLTVTILPETEYIKIYYTTNAGATALQWLSPSQTFGKTHPFLYTQGESIYTRSWVPCQDGPAARFTYDATIHTPQELMAVMSAANPQQKNDEGIYHFRMQQPVSSYLLALAVGDLTFEPLSSTMGVYAEPAQIQKCVNELEDLNQMMLAAEKLYGKYSWERYDVLFLPSGFPFGGMENPRLTFATPTILTGDKSLVNLIAHELAHSWSGNLVTNASWNDFWLNEGFTVYFERRIMEALEGQEYAAMLWDLGIQDLKETIADFQGDNSPYTKLKLNLDGKDPDLGFSDIAYEKGATLLLLIEKAIGRSAIDSFLNQYFAEHRFQTMNTEAFVKYAESNLFNQYPELRKQIAFDQWVYEEGLPDNCPEIDNPRFGKVDAVLNQIVSGATIEKTVTQSWSTHEWLHFLRSLKARGADRSTLQKLDAVFDLTNSSNAEIATVWFTLSVASGYEQPFRNMETFLEYTGRMKFLDRIYGALYQSDVYRPKAKEYFERYRQNYHPLAQKSILEIMNEK